EALRPDPDSPGSASLLPAGPLRGTRPTYPNFDGARVSFEAFGARELDDARPDAAQSFRGQSLNRDLPHEIRGGESATHARRASRREHMIRSNGVVARHLRRPRS